MPRSTCRAKAGQAVVLLLALLVALAALVVWIGASNSLTMRRLRLRDGGDAAALAAARWQAAGLNLVGELNLIQAYMLADALPNAEAAEALHELRQRVQLAVPFLALLSAGETAAANGLPEVPEAADVVREMAEDALFQDWYLGAEEDFRDMAHIVASRPLHAAPASPGAGPGGANLLVNQDFYEAVLGDDWCWFWFNAYAFLQHYAGHAHFGPVPPLATEPFLGLRLTALETSLDDLLRVGAPIGEQLAALGHPALPPPPHDGSARGSSAGPPTTPPPGARGRPCARADCRWRATCGRNTTTSAPRPPSPWPRTATSGWPWPRPSATWRGATPPRPAWPWAASTTSA